ncbi:hypothetical protein HZ994_00020 [Akkermansiaceae bacterium]|nr:hypothetical protein HZ994_00020 [Akkermansiaceae bacterium]
MNRFQIEDIAGQDKHGIVYRAHDSESGKTVSLRRFLPFGQEGGGLEKDEAEAFGIASMRLADVSHIALRSVITGSVDPIDGIPFLVTEWVEGMPLNEILAGEKLDPALVIDVLRIALEVSIVISHVLGEEAVWVETEVDSIIIGTRESGRGFTFWISPFKWLGAEFETRKLSSIVNLGEELTGWKRKLVSDHAGHGLGGWLKWLKNNPDARLAEALQMLAESTGNEPPPAEEVLVARATDPQSFKVKEPSSGKPLIFAALVSLLVIGSALLYLHKTAKPPQIAADYSEQEISPVIERKSAPVNASETVPAPDSAPPVPEVPKEPAAAEQAKQDSAADRANALAKKLSEEAAARDKALGFTPPGSATPAKPATPPATPATPPAVGGKIFTPADRELWKGIKVNSTVKLRGTIRGLGSSSTGKSIYLFFADPPDPEQLVVVIHQSDFQGFFRPQTFAPFVGKEVIISGRCFKEPGGRICAKIKALDHIRLVK